MTAEQQLREAVERFLLASDRGDNAAMVTWQAAMRAALAAPVEECTGWRGFVDKEQPDLPCLNCGRPYTAHAAAPVDREDEGQRCGKLGVSHLADDFGWQCALPKGHDGECKSPGTVATEGQECPACGGDGRERYGDWGSCHVCQDKNLKSTNKGEAQ